MAIFRKAPNGELLKFPDGTTEEEISKQLDQVQQAEKVENPEGLLNNVPDALKKNWLYMNYPHVGKHIMAIFNDGDIDITEEQIQPTSILKNDLAGWLDDDVTAGKRYLLNLNRFLAKIHNKLPYTIGDKRLAIGKIPLGKLTHEPDLSQIKKYRFIYSIIAY